MKSRFLIAGVVATAVLLVPGSALSSLPSTLRVGATMTGKHEVPALTAKVGHGSGRLTGKLTKTKRGYQFAWHLTYSHLSGAATFANIERGKAAKYGPVVVFLCSPCRSGAHGTFFASPGEVALLTMGGLYVNVRTKKHPAGEIRGLLANRGNPAVWGDSAIQGILHYAQSAHADRLGVSKLFRDKPAGACAPAGLGIRQHGLKGVGE